jgi:hypothetical protein
VTTGKQLWFAGGCILQKALVEELLAASGIKATTRQTNKMPRLIGQLLKNIKTPEG